jgi:hypothetical protein
MPSDLLGDLPPDSLTEHPDFPRFGVVSNGLRDAEGRLLSALKSGDQKSIASAKLAVMGSLDEYSKVVDAIDPDRVADKAP